VSLQSGKQKHDDFSEAPSLNVINNSACLDKQAKPLMLHTGIPSADKNELLEVLLNLQDCVQKSNYLGTYQLVIRYFLAVFPNFVV